MSKVGNGQGAQKIVKNVEKEKIKVEDNGMA